MEVYRPTKATIDLGAIRRNTQRIIAKYPGYRYYMAVVKADSYGYRGTKVVDAMLQGGANCLAASLVEEGLLLRQTYPELPILLFTPVEKKTMYLCVEKNLWVTVAN
jgi:alanine racemase